MAGAWPHAAEGKASAPVAISVGEPAGFANLTEEHVLVVDVYFGGVRKGEAQVSAAPGHLRFVDPAAVLKLLPPLADAAAVEAALSAESLPANAQLACSQTSDRSRCGRLEPDVAGVILNRDRFRIDIFVNPRFLAVQENIANAYLPEPKEGLAVINTVGAGWLFALVADADKPRFWAIYAAIWLAIGAFTLIATRGRLGRG